MPKQHLPRSRQASAQDRHSRPLMCSPSCTQKKPTNPSIRLCALDGHWTKIEPSRPRDLHSPWFCVVTDCLPVDASVRGDAPVESFGTENEAVFFRVCCVCWVCCLGRKYRQKSMRDRWVLPHRKIMELFVDVVDSSSTVSDETGASGAVI